MRYSPRAAAEFEERYVQRSAVTVNGIAVELTVAELHGWGRYAEPCDCGEEGCEGWAMGHQWEEAIAEDLERDRYLAERHTTTEAVRNEGLIPHSTESPGYSALVTPTMASQLEHERANQHPWPQEH